MIRSTINAPLASSMSITPREIFFTYEVVLSTGLANPFK